MVGHQYQYHHWIDRGDLLKANARFLQLQLRQRFRIAVDRHLCRRRDGHFSSVINRWLHRFRDLRRDSLSPSSSSISSRKRVVKDIYAEEDSAITRMLQAVAVPVLGNVCHVFMHGFNRVQIYGAEKLHKVLRHKSRDKPLVTVSNHVASIDDPFVIASLLPPRVLMDAQNLRWTLCATDRCFKNPVTSAFFRSVKVLPVSRGDGIYQKGLDMAIAKLNTGGWVHIFPEGSRSRDGGRTVGSVKRGVGRLVLDADNIPIVVPFVHTGMQEIMPIGANIPRIGKIVTVLVGDPIEFDDLLNAEGTEFSSRGSLYDAVSSRIGHRLQELKVRVDLLALEQSQRMKEFALHSMDRAAGILQHIDWESFGMKSYILSRDNSTSPEQDLRTEVDSILLPQKQSISAQFNTTGFSNDSSIVSRMRNVPDPTELTGFAAKGMFLNQLKEVQGIHRQLNPWRAWKQLLEADGDTTMQLC